DKQQIAIGATALGVGVIGGAVGNLLINKNAPKENSKNILAEAQNLTGTGSKTDLTSIAGKAKDLATAAGLPPGAAASNNSSAAGAGTGGSFVAEDTVPSGAALSAGGCASKTDFSGKQNESCSKINQAYAQNYFDTGRTTLPRGAVTCADEFWRISANMTAACCTYADNDMVDAGNRGKSFWQEFNCDLAAGGSSGIPASGAGQDSGVQAQRQACFYNPNSDEKAKIERFKTACAAARGQYELSMEDDGTQYIMVMHRCFVSKNKNEFCSNAPSLAEFKGLTTEIDGLDGSVKSGCMLTMPWRAADASGTVVNHANHAELLNKCLGTSGGGKTVVNPPAAQDETKSPASPTNNPPPAAKATAVGESEEPTDDKFSAGGCSNNKDDYSGTQNESCKKIDRIYAQNYFIKWQTALPQDGSVTCKDEFWPTSANTTAVCCTYRGKSFWQEFHCDFAAKMSNWSGTPEPTPESKAPASAANCQMQTFAVPDQVGDFDSCEKKCDDLAKGQNCLSGNFRFDRNNCVCNPTPPVTPTPVPVNPTVTTNIRAATPPAAKFDYTELKNHIIGHEGKRMKVYLDLKYIPTIGYGFNVSLEPNFSQLDYYVDGTGRALTAAQKSEFYALVKQFADKAKADCDKNKVCRVDTNTITDPSLKLSDGTPVANISTTQASADKYFNNMMASIYSDLNNKFGCFNNFPTGPKNALIDMQYSLGGAGLGKKTELVAAVNRLDWNAAAQNVATTDSAARNDWRRNQFLLGVGQESVC
ncbi:MAG: hypothetical protein FWC61_02250, partial [Proteobacteria bacterium]|nr:hypothetical protein [Pseudomonadota bacterium]